MSPPASSPRPRSLPHLLWHQAGLLEHALHCRWYDAVQLAGDVDAPEVRRLWVTYQRAIQRTRRRFQAIRRRAA